MSAINNQFSIVPIEAISDEELTASEFKVLVALYSFRDKNSDTCFPRRSKLAARAGFKDTTQVSKITTRLEGKGWLTKNQKMGFHGPKKYRLTIPARLLEKSEEIKEADFTKLDKSTNVDKSTTLEGNNGGGGVDNSAPIVAKITNVDKSTTLDKPTTTNVDKPTTSQSGKNYHHYKEQTSKNKPLNNSEPSGSADASGEPVNNSRLDRAAKYYDFPDQAEAVPAGNVFSLGVRVFKTYGIDEQRARSVFGMFVSKHGTTPTLDALTELSCRQPSEDPIAFMSAILAAPRSTMPQDWAPSPAAVSELEAIGIRESLVNRARAFFRLWILERDISSADFNAWFVGWCVRDLEDAELDLSRMGGWYGNVAQNEFMEPAGGTI